LNKQRFIFFFVMLFIHRIIVGASSRFFKSSPCKTLMQALTRIYTAARDRNPAELEILQLPFLYLYLSRLVVQFKDARLSLLFCKLVRHLLRQAPDLLGVIYSDDLISALLSLLPLAPPAVSSLYLGALNLVTQLSEPEMSLRFSGLGCYRSLFPLLSSSSAADCNGVLNTIFNIAMSQARFDAGSEFHPGVSAVAECNGFALLLDSFSSPAAAEMRLTIGQLFCLFLKNLPVPHQFVAPVQHLAVELVCSTSNSQRVDLLNIFLYLIAVPGISSPLPLLHLDSLYSAYLSFLSSFLLQRTITSSLRPTFLSS
jgi:hypothetical protein